jgi:hypothetical protein
MWVTSDEEKNLRGTIDHWKENAFFVNRVHYYFDECGNVKKTVQNGKTVKDTENFKKEKQEALACIIQEIKPLEDKTNYPDVFFSEETISNGRVTLPFKFEGFENVIFTFFYDPQGIFTRISNIMLENKPEYKEIARKDNANYISANLEANTFLFQKDLIEYIMYHSPKRLLFINHISKQKVR